MRIGTDALITIRQLIREDREPLERILRDTGVFSEDEIAIALELIDATLNNKEQHDYIAYTGVGERNEVLGYFCIGPTPATVGTYDLYWIAVKPSAHGKGVGKELLHYIENLVKNWGGRLLIAETSSQPKYDSTRMFYKKTKFLEAARIKDYYKIGDDLVVYAKYLS